MSVYKLEYFDIYGRAEGIRLIFHIAGVEYEEIRHPAVVETWPPIRDVIKPPFGMLPTLTIDGVRYCQSMSITRYLARKYGLAGKTELDKLRADMLIDCCEDITNPIYAFMFHEPDPVIMAKRKNTFIEETLPTFLTYLENILKENNGGDSFCVGDELTWADFGILNVFNMVNYLGVPEQLAKYPKLEALHRRICKVQKVAEWLEKRPKTEF